MSTDDLNVVLEVDDLHVTYHPSDGAAVPAVVGVSLQLRSGEIVGLVGESGCGKSSLALAVVGLIRAERGEVRLDGVPITPLGRRRRARADLRAQMVFQDPTSSLNPRKRASTQLEQALRYTAGVGRGKSDDVRSLLRKVGLSEARGDAYPHELSGGERQRAAIARALAASPDVIVADEPLAALDVSLQAQIANLFGAMVETEGVGILLISHDIAAVQQIADRLVVMYLGRFVEMGETTRVVTDPAHPYTRILLAAVPDSSTPGVLPDAPVGEVPNPAFPPSGCRFHPRCPVRLDRCSVETPPTATLDDGRVVECWLFADGAHAADESPSCGPSPGR